MTLRAVADVNLAAIERNVAALRCSLGPRTALCAVVKADGYGHGAVQAGRAALAGGARWLAVATAQEAAELREAGIAQRILVMGALSAEELPTALAAQAEVVAWDERFVESLLALRSAAASPVPVHVKLDSGMGRLGTRHVETALAVAERVAASEPALRLAGAMTHFATADDDQEFVAAQLAAFEPFAAALRKRSPGIVAHAANSAATMFAPQSHFDLVRCGIAIYGCDPRNEDPYSRGLEPALGLRSYIAALKRAQPGDSVGYGRRFIAQRETCIATLPIGYADGIRRAFTNNCDVLVRGGRYPLVGTVSMDNVTIDVGPDPLVRTGDSVTLIGSDGPELQTAEDLAQRIGTINYEVLCGLSSRVTREYHLDGEPMR